MVRGRRGRKSWKTVQLPEELIAQVDRLVRMPELGYTSRSDFIKEAVRLRIAEIEEYLSRKEARGGREGQPG